MSWRFWGAAQEASCCRAPSSQFSDEDSERLSDLLEVAQSCGDNAGAQFPAPRSLLSPLSPPASRSPSGCWGAPGPPGFTEELGVDPTFPDSGIQSLPRKVRQFGSGGVAHSRWEEGSWGRWGGRSRWLCWGPRVTGRRDRACKHTGSFFSPPPPGLENQLTTKEKIIEGSLTWRVYHDYIQAAGGAVCQLPPAHPRGSLGPAPPPRPGQVRRCEVTCAPEAQKSPVAVLAQSWPPSVPAAPPSQSGWEALPGFLVLQGTRARLVRAGSDTQT